MRWIKLTFMLVLFFTCFLAKAGNQRYLQSDDLLNENQSFAFSNAKYDEVDGILTYQFDGETTKIELNPLDFNKGLTFCAWIQPSNLLKGNQCIAGIPGVFWLRTTVTREIQFTQPGIIDNNTGNLYLSNRNWIHVALTIERENISIFADGEKKASFQWNGKIPWTKSHILFIGKSDWSENFYGQMRQFHLWSKAISPQEISNIYQSELVKPNLKSGLLVYFPFIDNKQYISAAQTIRIENIQYGKDNDHRNLGIFSGFGSHIDFGIQPVDNMVTVAMWVKPQTLNREYGALAAFGNALAFRIHGSDLLFTIPQVKDIYDSSANICEGKWQHLAFSYKEDIGVSFYVNGEKKGIFPVPEARKAEMRLLVGTNSWNDYFKGELSDFLMWERLLTDVEIKEVFKTPSVYLQKELIHQRIGWWWFLIPIIIMAAVVWFWMTKKENSTTGEPETNLNEHKLFEEKLNAIIMLHISNSGFSVDVLAREMAMSRTKLYNEVRQHTGFSVKEYIRIVRLDYTSSLLLTTNKTIAEIASDAGFESRAFFNQCFKKRFGATPKEYRQSN